MGSEAEAIIGEGAASHSNGRKKTTHIFNMGLDDFDKNEMINKVTGILSGMVVLSGVAMVIGGIVVLAVDCTPDPNHPWDAKHQRKHCSESVGAGVETSHLL